MNIIKQFSESIPQGKRGLILMDNFSAHKNEMVFDALHKLNIDILFFPSNCTQELQPLDLAVNKPFKDNYSEEWSHWFETIGHDWFTYAGNYKAPIINQVVTFISKVWEGTSNVTVLNSFGLYDKEIDLAERHH